MGRCSPGSSAQRAPYTVRCAKPARTELMGVSGAQMSVPSLRTKALGSGSGGSQALHSHPQTGLRAAALRRLGRCTSFHSAHGGCWSQSSLHIRALRWELP